MLASKTIHELHDGLKKREFTSKKIVESVIARINDAECEIKAYLQYDFESALKQAEAADQLIGRGGEFHQLTGIPIAIKDNICTSGVKTTCASKILHNFIPPYNATVIEKLKCAGFVMMGKTNLDEFAMGSSTENSSVATTKNPWDTTRVPGGSSGGSAAAVAADLAISALGSDTGGSIRQPASFCGIVGFKPTYGRISRYGLIAFASSLDQIGPMTKDVEDAAIISSLLFGHDKMDSTSADMPVPDFTEALNGKLEGLKIGVPKEYFMKGMHPDVESSIRTIIDKMSDSGAIIVELSLPATEYAIATYYIIATAEASSNLSRYDGIKYGLRAENADNLIDTYFKSRSAGFGTEVKRRIMLGTYVLSAGYYDAYYLKAQKVRRVIKKEMDTVLSQVDLLVTPTTPTPAFTIGEKTSDPLSMYLSDIFTISSNLAGNPSISVPAGLTAEKLPVGLQIIGKNFDDETVIRAAKGVENIVGRISAGGR